MTTNPAAATALTRSLSAFAFREERELGGRPHAGRAFAERSLVMGPGGHPGAGRIEASDTLVTVPFDSDTARYPRDNRFSAASVAELPTSAQSAIDAIDAARAILPITDIRVVVGPGADETISYRAALDGPWQSVAAQSAPAGLRDAVAAARAALDALRPVMVPAPR